MTRNSYATYCTTLHGTIFSESHVNTRFVSSRVQVRSAISIEIGEPLYLSYTYVLTPTITRREFLLESKFFNCECQRCADPTELGTHLSTLKCNKCDNGVILSTNPLGTLYMKHCIILFKSRISMYRLRVQGSKNYFYPDFSKYRNPYIF